MKKVILDHIMMECLEMIANTLVNIACALVLVVTKECFVLAVK